MLNSYLLFNNLFRSSAIIPTRLYTFGVVVLGALKAANDNHQFDAQVAALSAALDALLSEMSDVDTNLGEQKINTQTVDEYIAFFCQFMSDNEDIIAKQLGGKTSPGYREFYQNKQGEYSRANKTTMPILTKRVYKLANKYKDKLEADLVEQLTAFDGEYSKQYSTQQVQINTVKTDRDGRASAFVQTQIELTTCVHAVAMAYPCNVEKCSTFFPFTMLYPQGKKTISTLEGVLEKNEVLNLANVTIKKSVTIALRNTGTNAAYAFWVTDDPTKPMPEDATVIEVGSPAVTMRGSQLGDLQKNTFFMVKNISGQNTCSYEVVFTGLEKRLDNAVETEAEQMMSAS